jgi:pSer/pThr/pTyr-binding forkhead associated (FHA) protein
MKDGNEVYLRIIKGRVEGYKESDLIPLNEGTIVIGRPPQEKGDDSENPDFIIADDYVSKEHLKIYYDLQEKSYVLEERPAGTPNHTFLNDTEIEPGKPCPLTDGDEIGVARVHNEYRVVFRFRKSGEKGINTLFDKKEKDLKVDLGARSVKVKGKEVTLRKKEYDLLAYLYQHAGKACSREEIAVNVWKGQKGELDGIVSEETIDTTVHRLREAIEPDVKNPRYIKNIHNFGFRLDL